MSTLTLLEAVRAAQKKVRAREAADAAWAAERAERTAKRRAALERCLAGFDYELERGDENDLFFVALRHPRAPAKWLTFQVGAYDADHEPTLPLRAHEVSIRAGRIMERAVPLALTASEYVAQNEQE